MKIFLFCRRASLTSGLLTLPLALSSCNEAVPVDRPGASDTEASESSSGSTTFGGSTLVQPSGTDGSSSEDDDDGTTFFVPPDAGNLFQCDLWRPDCPTGQKCMPYAQDGGNVWNATRCAPLDVAAGQPGDSCRVEGSGTSGVDSCGISSMCWDVDPETSEGTCIAFCEGSADSPVCSDPNTQCSITNDGALILCLPKCDPLT